MPRALGGMVFAELAGVVAEIKQKLGERRCARTSSTIATTSASTTTATRFDNPASSTVAMASVLPITLGVLNFFDLDGGCVIQQHLRTFDRVDQRRTTGVH